MKSQKISYSPSKKIAEITWKDRAKNKIGATSQKAFTKLSLLLRKITASLTSSWKKPFILLSKLTWIYLEQGQSAAAQSRSVLNCTVNALPRGFTVDLSAVAMAAATWKSTRIS